MLKYFPKTYEINKLYTTIYANVFMEKEIVDINPLKVNESFWQILKYVKLGFTKDDCDVIITTGPYYHNCYVGFIKKLFFRKKWVVNIYDPDLSITPFELPTIKKTFWDNRMPMILNLIFADKVVFICEEQRDFIKSKYPLIFKKSNTEVIYLNYQDLPKAQKSKKNNNKIELIYTGSFFSNRDGAVFFKALDNVISGNKKIHFKSYGNTHDFKKPNIKNFRNIKFEDIVEYEKALQITSNADILVVIDADLSNKAKVYPYIPSKLMHYINANRPIIVISQNNSPSTRIAKEIGCMYTNFNKDNIEKALIEIVKNPQKYIPKKHKYTNEHISKQYGKMLKKLVTNKKV